MLSRSQINRHSPDPREYCGHNDSGAFLSKRQTRTAYTAGSGNRHVARRLIKTRYAVRSDQPYSSMPANPLLAGGVRQNVVGSTRPSPPGTRKQPMQIAGLLRAGLGVSWDNEYAVSSRLRKSKVDNPRSPRARVCIAARPCIVSCEPALTPITCSRASCRSGFLAEMYLRTGIGRTTQ